MRHIEETVLQKCFRQMPEGAWAHVVKSKVNHASIVFESWDEVFASEEWKEVWSGFQGKESRERVKREFKFVTAFRVDVDPKTNYGQPFKLFMVHEHKGVNIMKEATIHSMLSNSPLAEVMLFDDCFYLSGEYFKKGERTMEWLRSFNFTKTVM